MLHRVLLATTMSLLPMTLLAQHSAPDAHAPIGIMSDHLHEAGEFMFSYRFMQMNMKDNLAGSDSISPDEIATTVPNRFSSAPMMPPTLRVVPLEMKTTMHMVGMMYAPTDRLTVALMLNLVEKDMDHLTYQGGMGTNTLGEFNTNTDGMGDTKFSILYGLLKTDSSELILNMGLSIPTGDIDERAQILTPMNMTPSPRSPYAMQLGSGTYDLEPGLTWKHQISQHWQWGAQARYLARLEDNDEDYNLGDRFSLANWVSYRLNKNVSTSLRITYTDQDNIDGLDQAIMAPVQTADPDNYGGERWDLGFGVNFILPGDHRIALEYETTIDQDVNGVQLEMQDMLTLGYQLAF
ncbi:MAG: hypothetical protein ACI9B9_001502 [Halioglobus sp.]|jgi:hypothetical protein